MLALLVVLVGTLAPHTAATQDEPPRPLTPPPLRAPVNPVPPPPPERITAQAVPLAPVLSSDARWGFNHVYPDSNLQQLARNAGARWNRWEFRWDEIQPTATSFDWALSDAAVDASVAHGLSVQAILISVPAWARDPQTFLPRGLYLPWNHPDNLWARFVQTIATRYRDKIDNWEAWNEPDNTEVFWPGTISDYYQLLKVTYLSVKSVDSPGQVLVGGLTYWHNPSFLDQLLQRATSDPTAPSNHYYFDAIVWHLYSRPADLLSIIPWSRGRLNATVGSRPIWVNETNVPAWNESQYNNFQPYQWAATTTEQASYVIQSFAYAVATELSKVLVYRFQDVGETQAWGMVRADRSFRPAYVAYQVAARYLSHPTSVSLAGTGSVEQVVFTRGGEKITVLWSRNASPQTFRVPASSASATIVEQDGSQRTVLPSAGGYNLTLARATANQGNNASDFIIGGPPLLLVERFSSIQATPNPVAAGLSHGSTRLDWDTGDGSPAQVYVSVDGGDETLFADIGRGSGTAPWIAPGRAYAFHLYAGRQRSFLLGTATVTTVQPTLAASPNPVPTNSTTISWDMQDGTLGQVYVSVNDGPEMLFAQGVSGAVQAPWIQSNASYDFRLYQGTGHTAIRAEVTVTRISSGPTPTLAPPATPIPTVQPTATPVPTPVPGSSLQAVPNPVPSGAGLGTTAISWNSGSPATSQVYVSVDSGPEALFTEGPSGTQNAPWIQTGRSYRFRLYSGTAHATVLREVTVTRGTPILTASPNPVPSGSSTTSVHWETGDDSNGEVRVSMDGGSEVLFSSGPSGTSPAPWIQTGPSYEFRLYRSQTLLTAVTVTHA